MRYLVTALVVAVLIGVGWGALVREPAKPLPKELLLNDVTGQPQSRNLSCESRSAADLAGFWGVAVQESEFLERLPRSDNPHKGFVGTPDDRWGQLPPKSYGVYAEPVAALLREYGLPARAESRRGVAWLRQQLAANRPVIIWATYEFEPRPVVTMQTPDGSQFKAVPFEHTYLVVGYTPEAFEVIDALDGQHKSVPLERFQEAWGQLDEMAVVATDPKAVGVQTEALLQGFQTYGLPILAVFFLLMAFVTWRKRAAEPASRSKGGRKSPPRRSPGRRAGVAIFEEAAVAPAQPRRAPAEPAYRLAKTLGLISLIVGLILAIQFRGFNPFLGIPLLLGCGGIGYLIGYLVENWGRE